MSRAAPYIASPFRRVVAGAMDWILQLFCFALAVGLVASQRFLGVEVVVVAAAVYLLYHAFFFWYFAGATPGQRALNMSVVRASDGSRLSFARGLARTAFRPMFYFAYFWPFLELVDWLALSPLPARTVYLAPVFLELGMMFTLPSRQTLSDIVARTLVVNVPPPQPHRAPAAPMYSPSDAEFGLPPRGR